ncbi:protein amalgam-like [Argiope bruennichi]|uniref:protein amalgam-like n=1 Tax=Argiope bruennichi TaxID=94029 RepID=UPI0024949E51|nr:protein amalgam-like [Argiope bruennichi]
MGIVVGTIASSVLWLLATGAHHKHLRLEPTGHFHAFFTGDSFFITCSAGPNSGATRLTWQAPSGKDITVSTGRVHVEAAPDNPYGLELVFEDVKYEDRGTYVCSAIIDGREARTHFVLTVYLSITFWGTPEHQVGKEGTDFMVLCNVRSDPSPIISWYVNGTLILDGPKYTITEDGLYIRNLKPTDYGNYTCRAFVVTPHSSQMKDRDITVHVHYRPIWHTPHMELAHGVIGSSANLTCAAHSQPPPVFEWFREMVLLGNSKLYRIINQKWKSILQVKIKDASVFGDYHCVVSNTMGKVKRKITLVEGIVPAPPEFTVWSDEPGILIIKFAIPPHSILPILEYRIEWKLTTDTDWHQARYHQASDGNEFVIHGLSFESDYSIRIAARNTVGYSNYSEEVVQRTKGLIAETVVDGSSVSSSFNSAVASTLRADIFQHYASVLVLYLIIVFKNR